MLSTAHRLRSSRDFSEVVRRGRRAGRPRLTLHVLATQAQDTPRAGLVVSKAVGNAVVRHQVSRRLRHLLRDRVPALPSGTLVVVRASPQAGSATSAELAADLDGAFRKLVA